MMEHKIDVHRIAVLLVSDNKSDIHEVKKHITKTMGVSCHIRHCSNLAQTMELSKEDNFFADIVLLGLNLIGSERPREIFQQMWNMIGDTPIIIFTEKEDHKLALLLVEEGAADNVTRGQFYTDPNKLRDAIEFSLARAKISKTSKTHNAAAMCRLGKRGATDLKNQKEYSKTERDQAENTATSILKETEKKSTAILEEKDATIFWMGGGYSIETKPEKKIG